LQDAPGVTVAAAPDSVKTRVKKLVDRGLERYGAGDLTAALSEWEHALTLDPDNRQASEFVQYVRANFDGLTAAFGAAHEAADAAQWHRSRGLRARRSGVDVAAVAAAARGDHAAPPHSHQPRRRRPADHVARLRGPAPAARVLRRGHRREHALSAA